MKRYFLFLTIISFLLLSCSKTNRGELLEIPIDIDKNIPLTLSEITEELTSIDLELIDESIINPMSIRNVFLLENELFIVTMYRILVFNKEGKYLNSIGSMGQGPGEYNYIKDCALDKKNRRLFITTYNKKVMSYDFNGNLLVETIELPFEYSDLNYINDELLLLVRKFVQTNKGTYSRSELLHLNDALQITDSCTLADLYFEKIPGGGYSHRYSDFIIKGSKYTQVYYGDFYNRYHGEERFLCDTLYRFEKRKFIPELKLKFKNDGVFKFIKICNIYRSSRYVFTVFFNYSRRDFYISCYDTKTEKGYIVQDGFIDDINQISPARIRPFKLDSEIYYYLHTNMKPDDLEEPNPTLYIGKLKK